MFVPFKNEWINDRVIANTLWGTSLSYIRSSHKAVAISMIPVIEYKYPHRIPIAHVPSGQRDLKTLRSVKMHTLLLRKDRTPQWGYTCVFDSPLGSHRLQCKLDPARHLDSPGSLNDLIRHLWNRLPYDCEKRTSNGQEVNNGGI